MDVNDQLFKGTSFSDLMSDVYHNSKKKDRQINQLISQLQPLIRTASDATIIVPLIKEYLDVAVKNDDHLVKLTAIVDNKIIRDYIDSLIHDSYDFTHIFKLLGCKSNINRDFIITKLESKSIQSKIIKKITNYKKIPKKTLDYYKTNCDKEISDEDIINAILKYLHKKYNEQSIFWIDIDTIYFNGWNKNELDEEGPREYIYNILCKSNSICSIM